tara:strand:- start:2195 stop:2317 length:123 start_codon:yes stop_codon:yes gene_type:complete
MILVAPIAMYDDQAMAGNKGVIKKTEQSLEDIIIIVRCPI